MVAKLERWATGRAASLALLALVLLGLPAQAVAACDLQPGIRRDVVVVAGLQRKVVTVIGPRARAGAPVLFAWHGFGGRPEQILAAVQPELYWPEGIVIAPAGAGRTFQQFGPLVRPGWQVATGELGDRDLALFDVLLRRALIRHCADPARVYSTGFSNGGFFTQLLACQRPGRLAAIATVGAGGPFTECPTPTAVHVTHGTRDRVVGYDFGLGTLRYWLRKNGCQPIVQAPQAGCVQARGCQAPVSFCSFVGDHVWPEGQGAAVAAFLQRHRRRSSTPTTP